MRRSAGGFALRLKELISGAEARPTSIGADLIGRVKKGLAAQAFANAVRIAVQVASVPLFLTFWGVTLYGEWLLLTALLTYLMLSNVGFTTAASNEMAMRVGAGQRESARAVFHSTRLLLGVISLGVLGVTTAAVSTVVPVHSLLGITLLDAQEAGLIVVLLAAMVIAHMQTELLQAGFRCEGRYGLGTFLDAAGELLIFGTVVAVVVAGGGPMTVALCQLVGYTLRLAMLHAVLRRLSPWLIRGPSHGSVAIVKRLLRPSLSFMAFPVGFALLLQGTLIVIGLVLGPAAVVTFNTLRMLTRYIDQLAQMLGSVARPEMSLAYGSGDRTLLRALHRRAWQAGLWTAAVAGLSFAVLAEWIVATWTGGKVEVQWLVFWPLLVGAMLRCSAFASVSVLHATNNHQQMALLFLCLSVFTVGATLVVANRFGLAGISLATLIGDMIFIIFTVSRALPFIGDNMRGLASVALRPPWPSSARAK